MAFAVASKLSARGVAPKRMVASKASSTNNIEYLKSLPGVSAPFPEVFDPASLSATASIKDIRRWRESELIHGRVAMLAAVGFVVQENIQDNQLFYPFAGRITGPAIYHFQQIKQGFWEPLLLAIGIAEAYRVAVGWTPPVNGAKFNALREEYDMGDLGFDPLGLKPKDPEALKDMQTKELNNGRLAMLAVAGFVTQELLFQHETLTWGGFNQALEQHPIDPSDIKQPPLPVEFPDRGLPNINDTKAPSLPSVNSLPSINLPGAIKNFQPPSLNTLANNTPDMPNVNALPKPSLPNLSGLKASAQDLANKLSDISKPTVSVPDVRTPGQRY